MTYQIVVSLILAVFLLNLALNLLSLRPPRKTGLPDPAPAVSIIIPARDEAENIGRCLESLLTQDYPDYEIIVLDDGSSDGTGDIVSKLAASHPQLRLMRGEPLPAGWAGKPHACYQAAKAARGEWLLFVDADTAATPDMLRRVIAEATARGAAMVSGLPRQITRFGQKTAIPLMNFFIMVWAPLWWLDSRKKPTATIAIGQFILFSRQAYWKMDGHAAVKTRIIEDVWLGVEVTRRGGRQVALDLSPVFATRMYDTMGAMWEGLVKWTYSVAALCLPGLIALIALAVITFFLPLLWLWLALTADPVWASLPLIIFQVAVVFLMRWLVDSRLGESVVAALLHPIGLIFWVLAAVWGMCRKLSGAGVSWKKRVYDRASTIE
jgi:chlorobactene glucosyltransferase